MMLCSFRCSFLLCTFFYFLRRLLFASCLSFLFLLLSTPFAAPLFFSSRSLFVSCMTLAFTPPPSSFNTVVSQFDHSFLFRVFFRWRWYNYNNCFSVGFFFSCSSVSFMFPQSSYFLSFFFFFFFYRQKEGPTKSEDRFLFTDMYFFACSSWLEDDVIRSQAEKGPWSWSHSVKCKGNTIQSLNMTRKKLVKHTKTDCKRQHEWYDRRQDVNGFIFFPRTTGCDDVSCLWRQSDCMDQEWGGTTSFFVSCKTMRGAKFLLDPLLHRMKWKNKVMSGWLCLCLQLLEHHKVEGLRMQRD